MKILMAVSNPPTREFLWTRHNVGRLFITEHLLRRYAHVQSRQSRYTEYTLNAFPKLAICLSQTYMNLSGKAAAPFLRKHEATQHDLMVVHDDLEHQFGNARIKVGGSAQGHNGIISVIASIGGKQFRRLQLGIGRPVSRQPDDVARYVLTDFSKSQREGLSKMFFKAEELLKKQGFL